MRRISNGMAGNSIQSLELARLKFGCQLVKQQMARRNVFEEYLTDVWLGSWVGRSCGCLNFGLVASEFTAFSSILFGV
jgi:hypothetical protein